MLAAGILAGCGRSSPGRVATTSAGGITVASLSPAATQILIGLGAGDRLVAVSNFDPPTTQTGNLPRVGDYQTTDWERLASLHPGVMVTQFGPGRTPQGLVDRARSLHIRLVNVSITRLKDIYAAMTTLADAIGEHDRGRLAVQQLRRRLEAITSSHRGDKVATLIVLDSQGRSVAGRDNYLNDVLEIAGGENVITGDLPYPQIDREKLLTLDPPIIFQLLPDSSPQVLESAKQMWDQLPQLRAVKHHQVHIITESWALSPSQHVADLAQMFARGIERASSAGGQLSSTQPAP